MASNIVPLRAPNANGDFRADPPLKSRFIDQLLSPVVLTDREVKKSLAAELQAELKEIDREMDAIVSEGRSRTYYLSPIIYEPVSLIERRLADAVYSRDNPRRPRSDFAERHAVGVCQQLEVELDTAIRLRAARLPVSHTDRPTYWQDLYDRESRKPIVVNPSAPL